MDLNPLNASSDSMGQTPMCQSLGSSFLILLIGLIFCLKIIGRILWCENKNKATAAEICEGKTFSCALEFM